MAVEEKSGFRGAFAPADVDLSRCVHCGLCLQHCPTYTELGLETESPRGRLYLIKAIAQGRIEPTPNAVGHLNLCLQCRNCEAVCPSGVPYGRIMEGARSEIFADAKRAPLSWRLRAFLLRQTVLHQQRLQLLASLLRVYQRSGLRALAERVLPKGLRDLSLLAPVLEGKPFKPSSVLAGPQGTTRYRVALLTGCIMPVVYGRVHEATVRVLARNGCEVVAPPEQACCGALFAHNGDRQTAIRLAKRNIDAFLAAGVDAVVVNSAGCSAAMKEYGELLAHDREYAEKAHRLGALVKDVTEFLAELPFEPPVGSVEAEVTYQDACHLAHAQGVREAPRAILRSIPGLRLVEMEQADRCCGSAGVYSFTNREMSLRLLDGKMREVAATGARVIATANPGCMVQLEAGLRRHQLPVRVVHVVELLAEAYRGEATAV